MQTRNRIFDDLAKVANSAVGTIAGLKGEVESMVRYRMEALMSDINMVSREEFDAFKAMAAKVRSDQAQQEKRIKELEAKLNALAPTPRVKKKAVAAKKARK